MFYEIDGGGPAGMLPEAMRFSPAGPVRFEDEKKKKYSVIII